MVWRVRLGQVVINRKANSEYLFDLCRREDPPCIAVGWGKIDLSRNFDEIRQDYEQVWGQLRGKELSNIRNWVAMNTGDIVLAMRSPGTICAVGEIISERPTRYWRDDERFRLILVGGRPYTAKNPYGEVRFFNRIDVSWIPSLDKCVKVSSLDLPELIKNRLLQPPSIIQITANDFNLIQEAIESYVPVEDKSPPKYNREYDLHGKSGR